MNRLRTPRIFLIALAATFGSLSVRAADRPNIVFVFTGDHAPHAIKWMKESGARGQYPEAVKQLRATYDHWRNEPGNCVNPEFDQFKVRK